MRDPFSTTFLLSLAAAGALALTLSLLPGCQPPTKPAAASESTEGQTTPVLIAPVGRADLTRELVYVADLEASAAVTVISPVTDRIQQFPADNGDEVRAGQVLAVVRSESLGKGLEQAAANVEGLEIQLAQAEADLARSAELLQREVITEQTYEQVETQRRATAASLEAARAAYDQLAVSVGDARVEAPIGGVVADRTQDPGDYASMQVPLCRVLDVDPIVLQLRLTEADVARVEVGQEVALQVDARPGETFTGSVQRIMPYLDAATRTNTVEVHVPNPRDEDRGERALKPGMFGRATIVAERREGVVAVADDALVLDSRVLAEQAPGQVLRKAFVVDDGGVARQRTVEVGLRDDGTSEILTGLAEGDRLVVRGQHQLRDGERVTVIEEGAGEGTADEGTRR